MKIPRHFVTLDDRGGALLIMKRPDDCRNLSKCHSDEPCEEESCPSAAFLVGTNGSLLLYVPALPFTKAAFHKDPSSLRSSGSQSWGLVGHLKPCHSEAAKRMKNLPEVRLFWLVLMVVKCCARPCGHSRRPRFTKIPHPLRGIRDDKFGALLVMTRPNDCRYLSKCHPERQ